MKNQLGVEENFKLHIGENVKKNRENILSLKTELAKYKSIFNDYNTEIKSNRDSFVEKDSILKDMKDKIQKLEDNYGDLLTRKNITGGGEVDNEENMFERRKNTNDYIFNSRKNTNESPVKRIFSERLRENTDESFSSIKIIELNEDDKNMENKDYYSNIDIEKDKENGKDDGKDIDKELIDDNIIMNSEDNNKKESNDGNDNNDISKKEELNKENKIK